MGTEGVLNDSVVRQNTERKRPWLIWAISFAVWISMAFFYALSMEAWQRSVGKPAPFRELLRLPLLNYLIAAFTTPPFFRFAQRFLIDRTNWKTRIPLHFLAGAVFTAVHMAIRISVYPVKNEMTGQVFPVGWDLFRRMFTFGIFDDLVTTYFPIVVLAHMVVYYQRLTDRELRNSQLEAKLAHAQLQMLKMQLHPHFLFNTLHAISALMRKNTRAAEEMIARLSDLLRVTLENAAVQEVTLKSELDFVQRYLEIEQVRFADRLKVEFDIDPEVLDARVPNLILQPLVENAVRHGVAARAQAGKLRIAAHCADGLLRLAVQDNGPGISGNGLKKQKEGLGLANTRARLQQLYGQEQGLEMDDAPGGGLIVHVFFPLQCERPQESTIAGATA